MLQPFAYLLTLPDYCSPRKSTGIAGLVDAFASLLTYPEYWSYLELSVNVATLQGSSDFILKCSTTFSTNRIS